MKNVQFNLIKKAPFQCRRGISGGVGTCVAIAAMRL